MEVPVREQKVLLLKSGNRCAFPECPEALTRSVSGRGRIVTTGEIAHIVSASPDGPRGKEPQPEGGHNHHSNLIFLCPAHHKEIDDNPDLYTVERLRQLKAEHEERVERAISHTYAAESSASSAYLSETLYSTLLPVTMMPSFVWSAPTTFREREERCVLKHVVKPQDRTVLYPFLLRGGMLHAFNDLRDITGPFANVVTPQDACRQRVSQWLGDKDKTLWVVTLLNRTLNKLTGRKNLRLDKAHRRYFFEPEKVAQNIEIEYRPLNLSSPVKRKVVWQPVSKLTGLPRKYWLHAAVGLTFIHTGNDQWALTIRPEMRVTRDGFVPVEPKKTGSHVTRRKSKMFNYDMLEEVNFWRDFLSDSSPRINLNFGGGQRLIISTTLLSATVSWPGIPEQFAKPFKNIEYEDDLFSMAELTQAETEYENLEDEYGEAAASGGL